MAVVLVVDDEKLILSVLTKVLTVRNYEVVVCDSGAKALEMLRERHFDIMLSDVGMKPMDGFELLKQTRTLYPKMPVLLMTAFATVSNALAAMTLGAFDYVTKPLKIDELVDVMEHALSAARAGSGDKNGVLPAPVSYRLGTIIAESPEMQRVCLDIEKAAVTGAPSLLCGEIGTGKSLIAKAIHDCSARKKGDFIVLNCAEMPEPVIEHRLFGASDDDAKAGPVDTEAETLKPVDKPSTILLDEITMMPPTLLEKLILHLAKGVDEKNGSEPARAGLILTADETLESLSQMGGFAALLAQISGVKIVIRPLRERNMDILPLLAHFFHERLGDWKKLPALDPEVHTALMQYPWPGNHAEVEELVDVLLPQITDGRITKDILPPDIAAFTDKDAKTTDSVIRRVDHRGRLLKKFLQDRLPKKA